jgi:hypothetical protein
LEFRGDRGQACLSVQASQLRNRLRGLHWGSVEGAAALQHQRTLGNGRFGCGTPALAGMSAITLLRHMIHLVELAGRFGD